LDPGFLDFMIHLIRQCRFGVGVIRFGYESSDLHPCAVVD
jgi:hypothetical protein